MVQSFSDTVYNRYTLIWQLSDAYFANYKKTECTILSKKMSKENSPRLDQQLFDAGVCEPSWGPTISVTAETTE